MAVSQILAVERALLLAIELRDCEVLANGSALF
jgi:hypothetical protein